MESKDTMLVTMTLGQLIQAITEDPAIKEMVLGMVKTVLTNNEVEQIMEENLKGKPFTVKGIQAETQENRYQGCRHAGWPCYPYRGSQGQETLP